MNYKLFCKSAKSEKIVSYLILGHSFWFPCTNYCFDCHRNRTLLPVYFLRRNSEQQASSNATFKYVFRQRFTSLGLAYAYSFSEPSLHHSRLFLHCFGVCLDAILTLHHLRWKFCGFPVVERCCRGLDSDHHPCHLPNHYRINYPMETAPLPKFA